MQQGELADKRPGQLAVLILSCHQAISVETCGIYEVDLMDDI